MVGSKNSNQNVVMNSRLSEVEMAGVHDWRRYKTEARNRDYIYLTNT